MLGVSAAAALVVPAAAQAWAPLAPSAFRVQWDGAGVPKSWPADQTQLVKVGVTNRSDQVWPNRQVDASASGVHAVRLSYCWRSRDSGATDSSLECRQARVDLPAPLRPRDSVALEVSVHAPRQPGDYLLDFELVEELVRWFGDGGATRLTVPVRVADTVPSGLARPSIGVHTAQTVLLALAVCGLLFHAGFALTFWLATPRLAPALPLVVPVVGLGVLSALGHAFARWEAGTDKLALPIVALLALLNVLAFHQGARLVLRRAQLGGWVAGLFALLLGLYPLVRTGYLTALGGEVDGMVYATRAEHMQATGLARVPIVDAADVLGTMAHDTLVVSGTRQGDQYLLAMMASLTGLRPHRLFSILGAVFFALAAPGLFALARFHWRFSRPAATLAAMLAALHPLPHFAMMDGLFSQTAGAGAFAAVLLVTLAVSRARSWRTAVLAGFMIATFVTLYPAYTLYALVLTALVAVVDLVQQALGARRLGRAWTTAVVAPTTRLAALGALVTSVALLSIPRGWQLAQQARVTVRLMEDNPALLMGQASMYTYPHPGEWFGLVNRVRELYDVSLPILPNALRDGLLLVAVALVLGTLALAGRRARLVLLATLFVCAAAAVHQRYWMGAGQGFPYGYFKVVSIFAPLLVAMLVPAALRLARSGRAAQVVGLGLLASFGLTAGVQTLSAVPFFSRAWLQLDARALALESARGLVPANEPLLWLASRWPGRCWDIYLLGHRLNYDREAPVAYPAAPAASSSRLIRYALLADAPKPLPGEPWFDRHESEVLWSSEGFQLVRRRDAAVAELRFVDQKAPLLLASPLHIQVEARRLKLSGDSVPTGSAEQALDWCPRSLELTLAAQTGARLWLDRTPRDLPAGSTILTLPITGDVELRSEGDVRLLGVKALGLPQ